MGTGEAGPRTVKWLVELSPRAQKQLAKLDRSVRLRIVKALDTLVDDARPPGAKKLVGVDGLWRIRVGDHRILYTIVDGKLTVEVIRIAHRSAVYE